MLMAGIVLQQEEDAIGAVINMEELPPCLARTPDLHHFGARQFRLMSFTHQRRDDVARLKIEIVIGAIKIGGHGGDEVTSVLVAIRLAEFDPGDLGDRVPFIRGLETAGEKRVFPDRLVSEFRINAAGPEEEELFHLLLKRRPDDIRLDHQIVVDEISGTGRVGKDTADFRCADDHRIRFGPVHPCLDFGLTGEVCLPAACGKDGAITFLQRTDHGPAYHASMSRNPDAFALNPVHQKTASLISRRGSFAL